MSTALLIIDMQNDFVSPGGTCVVKGAAATVPAIASLIGHGRTRQWTIIYIVREHAKSGVDAEKQRLHLFRDSSGYTVSATWGAEIVEPLKPQAQDIIVRKWRFSGFFSTPLDIILRRLGINNLIICGTQYPNCIRATAVDGLSLDYDITICRDATSAQTEAIAAANILDMENMGIKCLSLAEIMAQGN